MLKVHNLKSATTMFSPSPGDIHFWNIMTSPIMVSWTLKEKSVFTTLLRRNYFVPLYLSHTTTRYSYRNVRATCETIKDGVRMRLSNAEKDLPKVNSTVVFLMHSEWSGLWILAIFWYVIIFSAFEKKKYSEKLEQFGCWLIIQTKHISTILYFMCTAYKDLRSV